MMHPQYETAAKLLRECGFDPTPQLSILASQTVQRVQEATPSGRPQDQANTIAREVCTKFGFTPLITAALENYRLAARRAPRLDIPRDPSVQDVAFGIVHHTLTQIAELSLGVQMSETSARKAAALQHLFTQRTETTK